MTLYYGNFCTPYGLCWVLFDDHSLYMLQFFEEEKEALQCFEKRYTSATLVNSNGLSTEWGEQLLKGKILLTCMPAGTPFQQSVWKALQQVPLSTVVTYADIARAIGAPKAVRAVANAVAANPLAILVPCHRVVRSDGRLGGYRWGVAMKKKLLHEEGVTHYV